MSAPPQIVVHGFETSNNMKVRVALGYKGIAYRFASIEPGERADIIRLSGQRLTPVLQHGDVTLFDSAAILRYLDANFKTGTKLFGTSMAEQWEIEDWELFARTDLAGPLMEVVHTKILSGSVDAATLARCDGAFGDATAKLAAALKGRAWLVGDAMTAADITAGAVMHRIRKAEMFTLGPAVDGMTAWIDSVMRYDGASRVD